MAKANLNQQSKRQRALAKQDKRAAKDEKRAQRKAVARVERGVATGSPPAAATNMGPNAALISKSAAAAAFIRGLKIRG